MSIFDTHTRHPLENILEEVEDVCNFVVPMMLTHYNANQDDILHEIDVELRNRGLWGDRHLSYGDRLGKIGRFTVKKVGFIRRIPVYKIEFFYIEKCDNNTYANYDGNDVWFPLLGEFIVGINGITHEQYECL